MVAHAMTAGLGGVQQSRDFGGRQVVLGAFVVIGGFAGADRRTLHFSPFGRRRLHRPNSSPFHKSGWCTLHEMRVLQKVDPSPDPPPLEIAGSFQRWPSCTASRSLGHV